MSKKGDGAPPILEGWLIKKGEINRGWKKRWFVLDQNKLTYYEKHKKKVKKGSILLPSIEGVCIDPDDAMEWNAYTKGRVFRMRATSDEEAADWVDTIISKTSIPLHIEEGQENIQPVETEIDIEQSDLECTLFIGAGCDLHVPETGDYYWKIYFVDQNNTPVGDVVESFRVSNPLEEPWNQEIVLKKDDAGFKIVLEYMFNDIVTGNIFIPVYSICEEEREHHLPIKIIEDESEHVAGSLFMKFSKNFNSSEAKPIAVNEPKVSFYHQFEMGKNKTGNITVEYRYAPSVYGLDGYLLVKVTSAELNIGECSPYWLASFNEKTVCSPILPDGSNWETVAEFPVEEEDDLVVFLSFYTYNENGFDTLLGESALDLEPTGEEKISKELSLILGDPSRSRSDSVFTGISAPNVPIIIIPDFGHTPLNVVGGSPSWDNSRAWFSLKDKPGFSPFQNGTEYKTTDPAVSEWLSHVVLQDDGYSDPDDIQARIISDQEEFLYFDSEHTNYTGTGKFIKNLEVLGYQLDKNLKVFPYDWRVPPTYLETRDLFFSIMRGTIEYIVQENGHPCALIGIGTGGLMAQYFLNTTQSKAGKEWIDNQIHAFVSIGTPFKGIPRTIRSTISGDNFGISNLSNEESKKFWRKLGSVPMMLPYELENSEMWKNPVLDGEDISIDNLLTKSGAENIVSMKESHYKDEELFEGDTLKVPALKRVLAIYGVNIPTETGYYYRTEGESITLDENKVEEELLLGHKLKNGILYETRQSNHNGFIRSGDGVNPYCSLSYPKYWENVEDVQLCELDGIPYESVLGSDKLLQLLSDYLGE